MTSVLAPVGALLMQAAGVAHDTLLMKQVVADRGALDRITEVASSIIAIALAVLTIVAIPVAFHSRRTYRKVSHLLDRVYGDIAPIKRNIHDITDNLNFITTSVRADVAMLHQTIDVANQRVQTAVAATEQRMQEFNALLAVVQEEAEQLFVSTASTVRGVRQGAAAFRDPDGMDLAFDELDGLDTADLADLAESDEIQEEPNGDDRRTESTAQALPAAPRVRPRQRSRRRP